MHCSNNSILSLAPRSYSSSKLGRQSLCGFRIERVEMRGRKFTGWDLALEQHIELGKGPTLRFGWSKSAM
jgi:hypothetical protein